MRIKVDHDRCSGHALCAMTSPNVYSLDSGGFNNLSSEILPEHMRAEAVRGADICPEAAITVEKGAHA